MGDEEETQVDEHLDPEDEIAFENAAPDEDDSGDAGSDYGSDEDYDDDKVRSLDCDGAREESTVVGPSGEYARDRVMGDPPERSES